MGGVGANSCHSASLSGAPLACVSSAPRGDVNVVRWSNRGDVLASGGDDGLVRLWAWEG